MPEAPKVEAPAPMDSEGKGDEGTGDEKKPVKPSNPARDEFMRRIEVQAGELLRRGSKDMSSAAAVEERRESLKEGQAPLLALRQKQAQRTAQLSRPRPLYAALSANTCMFNVV